MTPLELQDALVAELKEMFSGFEYRRPIKDSENEDTDTEEELETEDEDSDSEEAEDTEDDDTPAFEYVPISVYSQDIPIYETGDESDPIPYIIVRLSGGEDSGEQGSYNTVSLVVIIGVYDGTRDQQGYRDAMNIIQKIYHRFSVEPLLNGGKAAYTGPFKWAMQEDGYFPYFFAACNLNFHIPAVRREDPFT